MKFLTIMTSSDRSFFICIVLVLLLLNPVDVFSATVKSINNGDWSSPTTWDSGDEPKSSDDVEVCHLVGLDCNVSVTSGSITVEDTASVDGSSNIHVGPGGIINNKGIFNCASVMNLGRVENSGNMRTLTVFDNNGEFINMGSLVCETNFGNNGGIVDGLGGSIITYENIVNNANGYIANQFVCNIDGVSNPLVNSSGVIDSPTVIICGDPLPVELIYFEAVKGNRVVNIYWATATESNNYHFSVERSADGINFELVKDVKGAGNSSELIYYEVTDFDPFSGVIYYRLKQTDYQGGVKYSDIVQVLYNEELSSELKVFPNPSDGRFIVSFKSEPFGSDEIYITIKNLAGAVFFANSLQFNSGDMVATLVISQQLPPGSYIITGTSNQFAYNEKLVVSP